MSTENLVLVPTQGCYQKVKNGVQLVRETGTLNVVKVKGEFGQRRFRKSDGFEVGPSGHDFPRWKLMELGEYRGIIRR